MRLKQKQKLKKDLWLILFSCFVGAVLLKTGAVGDLLSHSGQWEFLGIFVAGMFFTSVFTTVPATVVLGELALTANLPMLVVVGGLGALFGDYILFKFFRDSIFKDLETLFNYKKSHRIKLVFKSKIFKVFLTLVGGLIIASPLPDELGLALMGLSKTNSHIFSLISFCCNAGGILIIALVARSLAEAGI